MPEAKNYIIDNPNLMKEWDWEKNNELGLDPSKLTLGSGKKAWWKCSKGHEWQAIINNRNKGRGCPICSGHQILKGYNDLATIRPKLAVEWHDEKNGDLKPDMVTENSNKKVWWKCDKGHEWQVSIAHRSNGNGCPYCSGRYAIKGENDLQTTNPTLAKEWNYEKNNGLIPMEVMPNSDKRVWWKCNKGHEWQATVGSRNNGKGCPICYSEQNTSFPEYALIFYIQKYGLETIHSYKEKGFELDVYIPSKKVAIEYDGYYWHKNKTKKDIEKNQKCKKEGIKLYRIREGLLPLNDTSIDYVVQKDQKDLSKIIGEVLSEIIGITVDIDIKRDSIAIENLREHTEKDNSILFSNPALAKEWNYEKNGNLKPENFLANSNKKVWWKCGIGHEWKASIADRNSGRGCPYCAGKKVLKGYNDLQTINPSLAKEWNYEKNGGLTPLDIVSNCNKTVWWKCSNGHEWQAKVNDRNKGNGCPYCSGRYAIKGENDLQTVNPNLAKEWNYEKNSGLTPMDVMPNSDKIVWWKCSNGHEWQASIQGRNKSHGCPYCSGRYVIKGKNDLQTANPTLAKEWNYKKNNELTPMDVMSNSHTKVWWICSKGHEWKSAIADRNRGSGCPYCSNKKVLIGYNDLQTINPTLAKEWNYEKNNGLTPMDVMPNSGKKVWWKCNKGHEWQSLISNRNKGIGCPQCAREKRKTIK